jgi:uncharacterized membrane protein YphA (DoxX/SURF4 family)
MLELFLYYEIRAVVALIFALSGVSKLFGLQRFVVIVRQYRLMPDVLAGYVAWALPFVEIALSMAILLDAIPPLDIYIAILLLMLFITGIVTNILRGNQDIQCGCFGAWNGGRLTWRLVGRNVCLTSLCVICACITLDNVDRSISIYTNLVTAAITVFVLTVGVLISMFIKMWRSSLHY